MIWTTNKQFNSFNGNEIKAFITNVPSVIKFIENNVEITLNLSDVCSALDIWANKINPLITRIKILDEDEYECELTRFEQNVKDLYAHGSNTVLTKNHIGDQESFYFHCLRFYVPMIARHTWNHHKLGVGVFSM